MPLVKGKHYPYTAAGKKAAARARMKKGGVVRKKYARGGAVRRSDSETALTPLAKAGRTIGSGAARARAATRAVGNATPKIINLNRTTRGPNS